MTLRVYVNKGLILAKQIKKEKYIFDLTFTAVHMGCQKGPKIDFQSQFSMSKIIRSFLNFFFIEDYQFRSTFFVIDTFDSLPLYSNSQNSMILFDYN